ncbi:aquaporin [Terribacillus saccharophilus]|uniref:Aquaporin n=1 Tax=Terribacillus saccharophilus TaxID=361277 RepID=A0A268HGS8_9BACI|nr:MULTISPECIES: MIP/aquaporin family protein [Terribacillus]PAD35940.1 aquaporin [Terribacillus saccharophilus]PAD97010.1 aquaporin [Terribacillus saccharophilus]PAE00586.1 aquaporin [Terribacillus saccharophilus]PAE09092.1 aquaporin [Terribacillus saccharophilus]
MSIFAAETIGTMVLILFGGGVVAVSNLSKSKGEGSGWIVITIAWGLAVAMGAYAVGGFSGAHLNPAVTLGLAINGAIEWNVVPTYLAGEMVGAFLGAVLVFLVYLPHWAKTSDPMAKLSVFATDPAIDSPISNMLTEIIGTFILMLGILFIGGNSLAEGFNPLLTGLLIVVIGMALGGPTGYAINPARDLGPRIAHALLPIPGKGSSNWKYAWVPVVGPLLGGAYGAYFYIGFFKGDLQVGFWILSAVLLVIIIAAVRGELVKANAEAAANNGVKTRGIK